MDRDPLNECDGRDETNDQDDLSEDTETFLRLLHAAYCQYWLGLPSQENSSPVLKPSLACQIFLFQNLSISLKKNVHKRSGTKKAVSFLSGGSLK